MFFVAAVERSGKFADKGPSSLLLGLGVVMIGAALTSKLVRIFGVGVGEFETAEFIAVLVAGVVILLVGSGLSLSETHSQDEVTKEAGEIVKVAAAFDRTAFARPPGAPASPTAGTSGSGA